MAGWQGLWTDVAGNPAGYSLLVGKNPIAYAKIKRFANRNSTRVFKELFDTLIGAASGGAALATHKQVAADVGPIEVGQMGGARTIETVTDINRNSNAGDISALKAVTVNVVRRPATYPADLSGNGGPTFT